MARTAVLAFALLLASCVTTQAPPRWPDTYQSRVEIVALLQTLNADILASTSATRSLERWCREHQMADEPRIVVHRDRDAAKAPSPEQLQRLGVSNAGELRYRRVELRCGVHVFSVADNWYVPARLTEEMNQALDTTSSPFGIVVQSLRPYRRTFNVTHLWSPLAAGWELRPPPHTSSPRTALAIPQELFAHQAILYTAEHQPFAEVHETYQAQLLAFERQRPAQEAGAR